VDLYGEYGVSATFNMVDLNANSAEFEELPSLGENSSQEGGLMETKSPRTPLSLKRYLRGVQI